MAHRWEGVPSRLQANDLDIIQRMIDATLEAERHRSDDESLATEGYVDEAVRALDRSLDDSLRDLERRIDGREE